MRWTPRRLAVAAAVRALQWVAGSRDAHTLLRARMHRGRAGKGLRAAPPDRPVRRMLITKTEQRGDVLLAIPAIRALRARHPGAELVVLGGPWAVEILRALPEVDDVMVLEHPPGAFEAMRAPSAEERARLIEAIKARGFDLGVDLTGDPWLISLFAEAGIPERVGAAENAACDSLTASVEVPLDLHRVDAMLQVAARAGAVAGERRPRLDVPEPERRVAEGVRAELGITAPYVVLHPGGRALKRWPIERFVRLAERLIAERSEMLVLLAGPDERDVVDAFAAAIASGRMKVWPTGSFLAAGELLRGARLHVGNDSGLAHLAAAVGTPTVTLFGPSRVSHWQPRSVAGVALSTDERCAYPCWPAVYGEPCSHHRCLVKIELDRVHTEVLALLERRGPVG